MKTIKYSLQGAYQTGVNNHPQKQVEKLGMKIITYEGCPVADCVFMEVDEIIDPLPKYIELSEYKLVQSSKDRIVYTIRKDKILVYIPVYARPEIFKICCENLHFPPWVDPIVVAVLSPDDPDFEDNWKTADSHCYDIVLADNLPLGRKMNKGLYEIRNYQFDYLMNFGSDDILSQRYWENVKPLIESKCLFFGMNQVAVYEVKSGEAKILKVDKCFGGGRMIHRSILVEMDWEIYSNNMPSGLDYDSQENIRKVTGIEPTIVNDCLLLDVKTSTNLNTYGSLFNIPSKPIDYETIRKDYTYISQRCAEIIG